MSLKLVGQDGTKIFGNEYLIKEHRGIVICVHGMCEHSKRYEEFALFLNQKGYSVYTYDHRGHGKSLLNNENKGYQGRDGFNLMVDDLNVVVNFVKEKHPGEKLYLLGHSMGSFVTHRYIQLYDTVDGVILSGSNYGFKLLKMGRFIGKIACLFKGERTEGKLLEQLSFGNYNSFFKPNRTKFDWLSRDEQIVDKYIHDDLCGYTCSNRFYYDFFGGLLNLSKKSNIKKINPNLPIFIISGDKDPVGNLGKGVRALYQVLRNHVHNVDMKLYKESRHEVLNELNKDEVFQDIFNWLTMIE